MQPLNIRLMISTLALVAFLGGCYAGGVQDSHATAATVVPPSSDTDEQLAAKVQAALHADPYLYDNHIRVSIEHGNVVLRGFVSNGGDLINAKKIAYKAAGGRRVIDDLSINPIEEATPGVRR